MADLEEHKTRPAGQSSRSEMIRALLLSADFYDAVHSTNCPSSGTCCWVTCLLVGPRPMSVRDVSLFSEAQLLRRFSVRPGMTGVWQVAGRSSPFSFDHWVALDFSYIDEWSLWYWI